MVVINLTYGCSWLYFNVIFFIEVEWHAHKNTIEGVIMGLGMDKERDELLEDRAAFIAG